MGPGYVRHKRRRTRTQPRPALQHNGVELVRICAGWVWYEEVRTGLIRHATRPDGCEKSFGSSGRYLVKYRRGDRWSNWSLGARVEPRVEAWGALPPSREDEDYERYWTRVLEWVAFAISYEVEPITVRATEWTPPWFEDSLLSWRALSVMAELRG